MTEDTWYSPALAGGQKLYWTTITGADSGDGMLYGQPSSEITHPAYRPNYLNQLTKCNYCGKVEEKCTCGGFGYA